VGSAFKILIMNSQQFQKLVDKFTPNTRSFQASRFRLVCNPAQGLVCARRSGQEQDAAESEAAEIQAEIEDKEQVLFDKWIDRLEYAQGAVVETLSIVCICFVFGCAIPIFFILLPIASFLLSRAVHFIAREKRPFLEHIGENFAIQIPVTHMIWVVRAGMLLTNATILVDLQFGFLPCVTWAVSSIVVIFVATMITKIRNAEGNETGIVCQSEVPPLGVKTDFLEINSLFHTDHENRGEVDTQDNTQLPNQYGGNESVNLPDMPCDPNNQHTNQTACEQNPFPLYTSTGIKTNTGAGDVELNDLFVDKGDDVVRTTCNAKKDQH